MRNRRVGPGSIGSSALIGIVFRRKTTDQRLHPLAIVMISISVVSLLMTVADRQLRTAPVWVKDSISSDKPTGAPSINMTELRPKELTP